MLQYRDFQHKLAPPTGQGLRHGTGGTSEHRDVLVYLAKEADKIKLKIEGTKIPRSEKMDQVCTWSGKIDKSIEGVDAEIKHLGEFLGEVKQKSQMAEKESEKATITKEREQHLAFEKEKLKTKLEYEKTSEEFKKVQTDIDGLPFNSEGYERVKTILKSEYGKTSEIVHAYVSNIMGLPVITGEGPKEINEFYKKLLFNVQSLETLGKLCEVSGNVRAVLDKLKGIKGELVRGHTGWRDWDFGQFIQAIK